jgi:O-antigen/teichoic acid export membrane protein
MREGTILHSASRTVLLGYCSRIWAVLLSFLLTPIYIKIIGIESFAIVGVTFSMQAVFLYLDVGFGTATTIEVAKLLAEKQEKEIARLLRIGGSLYWLIAVFLWVIFFFSSKLIHSLWLSNVSVEQFDLKMIIPLMGGVIFGLWPYLFYNGALQGLQRSDVSNKINWVVATVRGALALLVLLYVSPTVEAFLMVNVLTSLLQSAYCAVSVKKLLKDKVPAQGLFRWGRTDFKMVLGVAKKSFRLSGLGAIGILVLHADKLIVNRFVDLRDFGYYTFSWVLVYGMLGFCCILTAFFGPRFSYLLALKDEETLCDSYHQACQWMSVLIIPATLFFLFFSRPILNYWCRDPSLAANTSVLSSKLIAGACLFALCYLPQAFQVAHSWISLTIKMQAFLVIAWMGMLMGFVKAYGIQGAGVAWLILQASYLVIYIELMHRRLLVEEKKKWWMDSVIKPTLGPLITGLICLVIFLPYIHGYGGLILLLAIALVMFASSALAIKPLRAKFLHPFISLPPE